MDLRIATPSDVNELVDLHHSSWGEDEFSVLLGKKYLRLFYMEVITSGKSFCWVITNNENRVFAYACGFSDYESFNTGFKRRNFLSILYILLAQLMKWRISPSKIVDILRYEPGLQRLTDPRFHLGALALANEYKSTPEGRVAIRKVIERVLSNLESLGARSYWGVCDRKNKPMRKYLCKLGFFEVGTTLLGSKEVVLYEFRHVLSDAIASEPVGKSPHA